MKSLYKYLMLFIIGVAFFFLGKAYIGMQRAATINDSSKLQLFNQIEDLTDSLKTIKEDYEDLKDDYNNFLIHMDSSYSTYTVNRVYILDYGDEDYHIAVDIIEEIPYPSGLVFTNRFRFVREKRDADWYFPDVAGHGPADLNLMEGRRLFNFVESLASQLVGEYQIGDLDDLIYTRKVRTSAKLDSLQENSIRIPILETGDQFYNRKEKIFDLLDNINN